MRIDWYGQAAFHLDCCEASVFIDPIGDMSGLAGRGIHFEYPPVAGVDADLVLITHEHGDHNGAETISGDPVVLRSTAGRLESPIGENGFNTEALPSDGTPLVVVPAVP